MYPMSKRLVVIGSRGVYLAKRGSLWALVAGAGEVGLGVSILDESFLAQLFGVRAVRILPDAVELSH